MGEHEWLARRFEAQRSELRAVAFRILGSVSEADDAVQEAWLRLQRADVTNVQNLAGWLTTVVGRVCLDMLRSRSARREDPLDKRSFDPVEDSAAGPEEKALLADSLGLALLIVLDTLTPDERLAFVLHDMFAVPHREIASILDRTPAATKMLTSRARRRVRTADANVPMPMAARRHDVVTAFLTASRDGDFGALIALLHPDAVLRADHTAIQMGAPAEVHGAESIAGELSGRAQAARPAMINGEPGAAWAPGGEVRSVFTFAVEGDKITAIQVIANPDDLNRVKVEFLTTS